MGAPAFLVIDERPDGVFLYRFDTAGGCVGDTWHMNLDDARYQAEYEYEALVGGWNEVPEGTKDVVQFCLAKTRA